MQANEIDPKILAAVNPPAGDLFEEPDAPAARDANLSSGSDGLAGSEAQVKWAKSIRADVLKLKMPDALRFKFNAIFDSTWWIANRVALKTLKYREPDAAQMRSDGQTAAPTTPAEPPVPDPAANPRTSAERTTDAEKWAHSVSQNPMLAEAAILAVLARLYKESGMKAALRGRAAHLLKQGTVNTEKDIDAIQRMIDNQ